MRRPFLFKIASTNGLAALPAFTPGVLAAGRRAPFRRCQYPRVRIRTEAPSVPGYRTNMPTSARAATRQNVRTMKNLKKIAFFCLLAFAATSVADARFL
jgi:hypothetical protein